MKTSRYQAFSSTGGTEYPVNPVLDPYSPMISAMQQTQTESRNPVMEKNGIYSLTRNVTEFVKFQMN